MKPNRANLPPLSSLLPFEAAARHESITEAAAELNLTQAAVSKQIRALEDNLGTPLFERRNRAVYLTSQGQALQQVVRDALSEIAGACQTLRRDPAEEEIVLRSQQCEAIYWLMPRLSKFYQTHPEIELRVSVSTRPLSEASEDYDLALQTIGRDPGQARLMHEAADRIFPVCSPSYREAGSNLSLEELRECRLLHHKTAPQDWVTWDAWFDRFGLPPRPTGRDLVFDSYPMVMQAAVEGHGVAVGWHRACEALLSAGSLIRPCAPEISLPDGLGLYAPKTRPLRPGVRTLLDWLVSELE